MEQNTAKANEHFAEFFAAYIACALWATNDNSRPTGGEPLDLNHVGGDIAPESYARMRADCARFFADNFATLSAVESPRYTAANAGHDLWLTRNGHGAGYWDRGLGAQGGTLTEAAKAMGECDLDLGDDGRIHLS